MTIIVSADYGKPRPALVAQDHAFADLGAVTILRLTSVLNDWPLFWVTIAPMPEE